MCFLQSSVSRGALDRSVHSRKIWSSHWHICYGSQGWHRRSGWSGERRITSCGAMAPPHHFLPRRTTIVADMGSASPSWSGRGCACRFYWKVRVQSYWHVFGIIVCSEQPGYNLSSSHCWCTLLLNLHLQRPPVWTIMRVVVPLYFFQQSKRTGEAGNSEDENHRVYAS